MLSDICKESSEIIIYRNIIFLILNCCESGKFEVILLCFLPKYSFKSFLTVFHFYPFLTTGLGNLPVSIIVSSILANPSGSRIWYCIWLNPSKTGKLPCIYVCITAFLYLKISFLIQQTFVYLVLKFIFILVCSHYRNRTLSVLHNLRNSLVCTDKKINWATAVPTWNQPWPYLYHFTLFWNRTTPQQQLKST